MRRRKLALAAAMLAAAAAAVVAGGRGAAAVDEPDLSVLHVGVSPLSSEVVVNGTTVADWNANSTQRRNADEDVFNLYMWAASGPDLPMLPVVDIVNGSALVSIESRVEACTLVAGSNVSCEVPVLFKCHGNGTARVRVRFNPFDFAMKGPEAYFFKDCREEPHGRPTFLFAGTMFGLPDLMLGGEPVAAELLPVLGPNEDQPLTKQVDTVYYWLNSSLTSAYFFVVTETDGDEVFMAPTATCGRCLASPFSKAPNATQLAGSVNVEYNCYADDAGAVLRGATSVVTMTVKLDGFDEASVQWYKQCSPPVHRRHVNPGGGGGMSATGIFFLVLFCLLLAAFLAKWVYNAAVLKLSGADAVPCSQLVRECRQKVCGPSLVYTPQDDGAYAEPLQAYGATAGGGGGYQTNL